MPVAMSCQMAAYTDDLVWLGEGKIGLRLR